MKITVKENRELIMVNARNTQNENEVETLQICVPEKYEDFNKKIVFITDDGVVWDLIENDTYTLKRAITKYDSVKFYIWLTKDEQDFRSVEKTLYFNKNHEVDGEVTPEEQTQMEQVISILESEINKVDNIDIDASKEGKISTVTITNKQGNEKSVNIIDGEDGQDGFSPTVTPTPTSSGYNLEITDVNGTTTIAINNGVDGKDGKDGKDGADGEDYILTQQDKQDIAGLVDAPVDDVQVNGTSIVENGIANVPVANSNTLGVVKVNASYGINLYGNQLIINQALDSHIKSGTGSLAPYRPITPDKQYMSTFYGLAKAAGDTTQSQSSNIVGIYTEEAKAAIRTMLGVDDAIDAKITDAIGGEY